MKPMLKGIVVLFLFIISGATLLFIVPLAATTFNKPEAVGMLPFALSVGGLSALIFILLIFNIKMKRK